MQLDISDVSASYGARTVFHRISLTLRHGEVLVVSGANGSGKSTLLRVLCGLQKPADGTVRYCWNGTSHAPRDASHLIGWVSPDLSLYRELTGDENLRFFAAVRGLSLGADGIDGLMAQVGLGGRGSDRVSAYSSGMAHRLRYAYALLHHPPVLLLDEPTVTLDERGAGVVESIIEAQRQKGIAVVATNDPRELRYGDYVLTLGAG
ncbi:MAG: ATP-binding cassette domain-containing protein [Chloroflexaceae bacterium]|nr:ATP-binding cassette domain-containing protein [Chloroflexaceae bacterium]